MTMNDREDASHSWLHPDSLAQYDVIFAATTNRGAGAGGTDMTTAQFDALVEWVDSGHVIVAFHGATNSYYSGSNPPWIRLLGARFLDHAPGNNGGTVSYTIAAHPALLGTTPLPTSATSSGGSPYWDEGRRHNQYVNDTIVIARNQLATDVNAPWIWVRPQGKGWIYYNAGGHDGQTWKMEQWKGQVVQALKWGKAVWDQNNPDTSVSIKGRVSPESLVRMQGGELFVPVQGAYSLRITDMQGREVFFRPRSAAASQNVSSLPAGTYGVRILSETREAIQSLFIKKR
jgi:type 1 glutamine amidotransferase